MQQGYGSAGYQSGFKGNNYIFSVVVAVEGVVVVVVVVGSDNSKDMAVISQVQQGYGSAG